MSSVYLCLISAIISIVAASFKEPIVHTQFGTIRGKWLRSARNVAAAAYLGVPYAQPPIGALRFESPRSWKGHWKQIHNAFEDGPPCIQSTHDGRIIGREDCLYLNVFVPATPPESKLSVLVFVHGGSFVTGSNNSTELAPDYLMDQGIIVVTVNYRLGILGFLSSGNEVVPGNYGLKDVFQALRWINTNIEDFGGDKNSVTVSGVSAGAALVHHLALTNLTEGLFNKVITQSGTAIAPYALHPPRLSRIRYATLAIALNCTTREKMMDLAYVPVPKTEYDAQQNEEDEKILQCLKNAGAHDIVQKLQLFGEWLGNPHVNFGPTIEPESEDALIVKHPRWAIENRQFRDIPWMTGVVADEGLLKTSYLYSNESLREILKDDFYEAIPAILELQGSIANSSSFADELMDFYFPEGLELDTVDAIDNFTELVGDGIFNYWSYAAMESQSKKMNSGVYFYVFGYQGTFSSTLRNSIPRRLGVSHGDDINYLFPILNTQFADLQLYNTIDDKTMINIMTELTGAFVKTGEPFAELTSDWRPYQEDFRFMRLGMDRSPDISMDRYFLPMRMAFWYRLMKNFSVPREQLFFDLYDDNVEHYTNWEPTSAISGNSGYIFAPSYPHFVRYFFLLLLLIILF